MHFKYQHVWAGGFERGTLLLWGSRANNSVYYYIYIYYIHLKWYKNNTSNTETDKLVFEKCVLILTNFNQRWALNDLNLQYLCNPS